MIGCIAKATSDALHMDESEMDDVRWCTREQLKKAVEDSKRMDTPYQGQQKRHDAVLYAQLRVSIKNKLPALVCMARSNTFAAAQPVTMSFESRSGHWFKCPTHHCCTGCSFIEIGLHAHSICAVMAHATVACLLLLCWQAI